MRVFNIDITRKGISPVVQVTEYDAMSRFFTLVLRNGSSDYEPPENPTYSVWYKTKDSHGWYDTITEPDEGTHPAVVADGNAFTIEIAEQATTSCGELALMINGDDGYQLTVSGIITRSDDIPGYDGEEVENYYNVYITEMRENAARAENAADIAVAYGATVEVDEDAQQLNITHHSDTEGGVGWLFGSAVTSEAEGSVAAFTDGADDVAVKSLVAEITPMQSGSGDPSPTNVRPISGRTGMTVTRAGKNLFPSKTLSMGGTNERTVTINLPYTIPDGVYTMSFTVGGTGTGGWGIDFYDGRTKKTGSLSQDTGVVTLSAPTNRIYAYMAQADYNAGYTRIIDNIQLELGTVVTAYTPYVAPSVYPITWETEAGTIYGGTLDVVSGVLTVDKYLLTCGETITPVGGNYVYLTNPNRWQIMLSNNYMPDADKMGESISDTFGYYDGGLSQWAEGTFRFSGIQSGGYRLIQFKWADQPTTVADLKAFLAENPIHFVIPLATPQTYQLTPTEVRTILGGNTIYTDAGAVSVEYVADTKLYIDNKVAELQALILEN